MSSRIPPASSKTSRLMKNPWTTICTGRWGMTFQRLTSIQAEAVLFLHQRIVRPKWGPRWRPGRPTQDRCCLTTDERGCRGYSWNQIEIFNTNYFVMDYLTFLRLWQISKFMKVDIFCSWLSTFRTRPLTRVTKTRLSEFSNRFVAKFPRH